MELKIKVLSTLLVASGFLSAFSARCEDLSRRYLLVGRPVAVKFIRNDLSADIAPSFWRVTVKDVKVIEGDSPKFAKRIDITLEANHGDVIMSYGDIFLLVDVGEKGQVTVRSWGAVARLACVPSEFVVDSQRYHYVRSPWAQDEECTPVKGYMRPISEDEQKELEGRG